MKFLIVFTILFAIALAAPVPDEDAEILKLESRVVREGYVFE